LSFLADCLQRLQRHSQPVAHLQLSEADRAACAREFRPALDILENGCGFVLLDRLPLERYSAQETQTLYWLIGQGLGRPMEQNVQGSLLYDVRDTGQDVASGARFSVTNAESTFHTDNSFGAALADYVGLLCLQTAQSWMKGSESTPLLLSQGEPAFCANPRTNVAATLLQICRRDQRHGLWG
jgi:hypothetical protein